MLFLDVDDRHRDWVPDIVGIMSFTTHTPGSWNTVLNAKLSLLYQKRNHTRVTFKFPWPWADIAFTSVMPDLIPRAFPIATAGGIAHKRPKVEGFH